LSKSAVRAKIEAYVEWFIPDSLRAQGVDTHRRARLAIYIMTSTVFIGGAVGLFHFANGSPAVGIAYTTAGIIGGLVPPLLRVTGSLLIAGNTAAFLVFASHALVICFTGGLGLPAVEPVAPHQLLDRGTNASAGTGPPGTRHLSASRAET
jgi:hypothetical protein